MTGVTFASISDRLSRRDPVAASSAGRTEAAVALLLVRGGAGLELLLMRRAEREGDPWSGQMGLPGGRREPADHDLVATALRETREEIGVDLRSADLLGRLDDLAPTIEHLPRMLVRPFVFALGEKPELRLSREVAETIWTELGTIESSRVEETIQIMEWQRRVSGFKIGPHLVWGMTERILTPFIELTSST